MTENPKSQRRWLVWSVRIAVFVLLCWAVRGTVLTAFEQLSQYEWHVKPVWLVVAGLLYVLGLVPMAWFWYRTLAALGQPAPWGATLRAYFLGHLGKYVPGKAMSVILRVAAVRKWVPTMRIAIISTMLETLTMMAVGAFIAAAISAFLLRTRPELAAIAMITAIVVGIPTLPPIARWLARFEVRRVKPSSTDDDDAEPRDSNLNESDGESNLAGINLRLLLEGWASAFVCWLMLGLSLWATLRGIGVVGLSPINDLPRLVAAVAMAVVAGFVSMLPGGLGVRDLALVQLLAKGGDPADALVAAIMLRLVWLVSESAACVILYMAAKWHGLQSVRPPRTD